MSETASVGTELMRRDRAIIVGGVALLVMSAWAYLFHLSRSTTGMSMVAHAMTSQSSQWYAREALLLWAMWAVMMVAMMLPSVTPLILMFARANPVTAAVPVVGSATLLTAGYVLVWTAFSAIAAGTQLLLHDAALVSGMMRIESSVVSGLLLGVTGAFQFTPLKRACLRHCRSPLAFLMSQWHGGRWDTFVFGLKHGTYCVGCCWLLMALLFAAGVMNLAWVAAIATFILLEKLLPRGDSLGQIAGATLIVAGIVTMLT